MTETAAGTGTTTQTATPAPRLDDGDHDRFAHYVIGGSEAILHSMVTGEPVTALCG
ncbi:MAG: DUF3039 domain-containing protein, partial [Actinobacteria bacterium]|nr:DUF3039 domain-containing protein [Actinomycetota bacterium]